MLVLLQVIGSVFMLGLTVVLFAGLWALWQISPWLVAPAPVLAFFAIRGIQRQRKEDQWANGYQYRPDRYGDG